MRIRFVRMNRQVCMVFKLWCKAPDLNLFTYSPINLLTSYNILLLSPHRCLLQHIQIRQ